MQTKLTIPSRIKVGYQKRSDTYTGNLAYVIYFDHKGVLRKETSWKSWCDKKLGSHDFDNVPTEGFVLNKKVGGTKESYGWNTRQEYVRVYDPRNFEFEISIPNLLFILRECNCSKGKGLEGEFVYAWDGTSLVLLPVSSSDYVESQEYNRLQTCKTSTKDLVKGASYKAKDGKVLVYVGKFDYYIVPKPDGTVAEKTAHSKKHIYWDGEKMLPLAGTSTIAQLASAVVVPNYADLVDQYYKSVHGSKIVSLELRELPQSKAYFDNSDGDTFNYLDDDGTYRECRSCYDGSCNYDYTKGRYRRSGRFKHANVVAKISLLPNGTLDVQPLQQYMSPVPLTGDARPHHYDYDAYRRSGCYRNSDYYVYHEAVKWVDVPHNTALVATLESGTTARIIGNSMYPIVNGRPVGI